MATSLTASYLDKMGEFSEAPIAPNIPKPSSNFSSKPNIPTV